MVDSAPELGGGRMACPFCAHPVSAVKDSRPTLEGSTIRRRRLCLGCDHRFTTFERVQLRELTVLKRSGRRAQFDREKLERSVRIAMVKRPGDPISVDQIVARVVQRLESIGDTEISSSLIGEVIMSYLRGTDDVAFVRYASVYKDFRTAADFGLFLAEERLLSCGVSA